MVNINMIIADNILACMKKQKKKQTDLAEYLKTSKQTVNKMINGSRMINAIELKCIAEFLNVTMETLTQIPQNMPEQNVIHVFMGKVASQEAKEALEIADRLSDMILFHSRVKENGTAMTETGR